MKNSIVVNYAPTGMIPTKAMTPHVPVSVNEIVEDVHRACGIGITMVHLHARDENTGEPTHSADVYGRIVSGIRKHAGDLVVCVSLSGRSCPDFERRAEPLTLTGDAKPDMGSLTLSSLNFNASASVNSPDVIRKLAAEMASRKIVPELEAFDAGMINYAKYLVGKDLLGPPMYFNLILGNIACAQADLLHVGLMVRDLPAGSLFSLGGVGYAQAPMNAVAVAMGYGVRVGLEDNIWYDAGRTRLASNQDLLLRVLDTIDLQGKTVMSPSEMRKYLGGESDERH